jgi:hypothetical protein
MMLFHEHPIRRAAMDNSRGLQLNVRLCGESGHVVADE